VASWWSYKTYISPGDIEHWVIEDGESKLFRVDKTSRRAFDSPHYDYRGEFVYVSAEPLGGDALVELSPAG
jgi:hypothetical protein